MVDATSIPVFFFCDDRELRELRDKTMREINKKFAARNAAAAETRKAQFQESHRVMREENKLAEENDRAQKEKE